VLQRAAGIAELGVQLLGVLGIGKTDLAELAIELLLRVLRRGQALLALLKLLGVLLEPLFELLAGRIGTGQLFAQKPLLVVGALQPLAQRHNLLLDAPARSHYLAQPLLGCLQAVAKLASRVGMILA
jgi:hypothetical protein